jgi:hypothetical protein
MSLKSRPIFFRVLMKMRFSLLPPSIRTLVSLTAATTGSRTKGNLPGFEKLVHWSLRENEMGTSDQQSGRGTAGSMYKISRRSNFWSRLEPKSSSPPKMTLTTFEAS